MYVTNLNEMKPNDLNQVIEKLPIRSIPEKKINVAFWR